MTSKKIFVLAPRFPDPLEKGDKLRIYHQVRELSLQHQVVFCALSASSVSEDGMRRMQALCSSVHLLSLPKWRSVFQVMRGFLTSNRPLQVNYYFNQAIKRQIIDIVAEESPDVIYCQLIRMAEYVRGIPVPKVIDYMDAFSVGTKRWADSRKFPLKPLLQREAINVLNYERRCYFDFDGHAIIAEQDRNLLFPPMLRKRISIVKNGVETDFFSSDSIEVERRYDIVFVGSMDYRPNIVGAVYLVKEILPILLKRRSGVKVLIAGAHPTAEVRRLASENVHVSGWMDDIREGYASSKIFVAPLFLGRGMQNKVLEAMAMGLPCITTPLINQSIHAPVGKAVLTARDANEFAEAIDALLLDEETSSMLGLGGREFVESNYEWGSVTRALEEVLLGVLDQAPAHLEVSARDLVDV